MSADETVPSSEQNKKTTGQTHAVNTKVLLNLLQIQRGVT
jgi:hypothetical protein